MQSAFAFFGKVLFLFSMLLNHEVYVG